MLLPVTLTFAAGCAFINLWLAIRCVQRRFAAQAIHGDGGDPLLAHRMRAQGNFIEYTPIILILFALVELAVGASQWLWLCAAAFLMARIAHGIGMDSDKPNPWRAGGMIVTFLVLVGLAIAALTVAYTATRAIPAPPALASGG
ncbi:hypothetical protein J3E64_000629 [Sphingobium sp. OAS761]|uniref:MAPEG family protein n=1 Tax=Sphingobium sp. OAS761 TaxID=2817901 RepID=UPI00209CEA57|nr:MAPEG family protein [Sphingobium sp. OAS761]MCP1468958.1 hypothetical protein [Sphingobium sp. OAS761]